MMRVTIQNWRWWTFLGRQYPRYADLGERCLTIHLTVLRPDDDADLYVT